MPLLEAEDVVYMKGGGSYTAHQNTSVVLTTLRNASASAIDDADK